jgi:hypothetical protein
MRLKNNKKGDFIMNQFKILLMYSGVVNIPASNGQSAVNGLSVEYYFFGENGEQLQPKISADGVSGTRRGKVFLDEAMAKKVSFVPGIYNGTFEMSIGSDGKPVLKLTDIDFVGKAQIAVMPEKDNK